MAQRISGAYQLITVPGVYKGLMRALGSDRCIQTYVNDFLAPLPSQKVLDVGCGPAQVLPYLPAVDYVGIDLNEKHIAYAREHFSGRVALLSATLPRISSRKQGRSILSTYRRCSITSMTTRQSRFLPD